MPDHLLLWTEIATLPMAALLTFLIVQYTKGVIDRTLARAGATLPTDLYAVLVAWGVILIAWTALEMQFSWPLAALAFFNAFIIAAVAGQLHNKVLNPPGQAVRDTEAGE